MKTRTFLTVVARIARFADAFAAAGRRLGFAALALAGLAGLVREGRAADRPNILWLTFEDTSAYEIGCYGNADVKTPNIDRLAREGVRFSRAWSNGVQCSPSRSTIITGSYSPTFGTEIHRGERLVPAALFGFPRYLRESGYFTTNNAKTDYNASNFPKDAVWSLNSRSATYHAPQRAPGQPFFSVFNCGITHMSLLTTVTTKGRRDFAAEGLDPAKLRLPPHVPDLPEVRSDYAFHLEGVEGVDAWVGLFLADLAANGLADDTIVFVFSDHGGCLPRGKGFALTTGLHVPLVVYFPPKWRHLAAGLAPGATSDRLVGFVDLAPTVLSLAGIKVPAHMQGQPLLGPAAAGVAPRAYNFGFTANREDNFSPARAVTDGEYVYVRNYVPRRPLALRNFFQWGMPANLAWDTAALDGKLTNPVHRQPFEFTPVEQFFDLRKDYYNTDNLAADPAHAAAKARLSRQLDAVMSETADLGLLPRNARQHDNEDLYSWVRRTHYPVDRLQSAALRAARATPEDVPAFERDLRAPEPEFRYWAVSGLAELAVRGRLAAVPAGLEQAAGDPNDRIAAVANETLIYLGQARTAVPRLLALLGKNSDEAHVVLETVSLVPRFRTELKPFLGELKALAATKGKPSKAAMSVMANLGEFPPAHIYASAVNRGIRDNQHRRPLSPLPNGAPRNADPDSDTE